MLLVCDSNYSQKFYFRPPPTYPWGGWVWGGSTHVAPFIHTVFHINLFQLEYYVSVRHKRDDIKIFAQSEEAICFTIANCQATWVNQA